MKNAVLILSLFISSLAWAGGAESGDDKVTTNLRVVDALTGLPLIGADVHLGDQVFYTDPEGFVEIEHSTSQNTVLSVRYVSYQDEEITLITESGLLKVALSTR